MQGLRYWAQGVSPSLATELCLRAGLNPAALCPALSEEDWAGLHQQWAVWLRALEQGGFLPGRSPGGRRYSMIGTWASAAPLSASELVDDYYRNFQARFPASP